VLGTMPALLITVFANFRPRVFLGADGQWFVQSLVRSFAPRVPLLGLSQRGVE
jgi:hypothetical protein